MSLRSGASRLRSRGSLSNLLSDPRPREEWTLLGIFGVVLTGAVFAIVGGLFGALLALAFGLAWVFVPTVYSYALGHVLALGVSARAVTAVELLFIELGLVAVLLGPLVIATEGGVEQVRSTLTRSVLGAGSALFAVVVVALAFVESLWLTAALLAVVAGLAAYGLHRYERLALGLADDEDGEGVSAG
jgi:hypothetical protein